MKHKNKEFEKLCVNCGHAIVIHSDENVLCRKKGIVSCTYRCGKFTYDPLKRIPSETAKIEVPEFVDINAFEENNITDEITEEEK